MKFATAEQASDGRPNRTLDTRTNPLGSETCRQGYAIVEAVFSREEIQALLEAIPDLTSSAGTRTILDTTWGADLASDVRLRKLAGEVLGGEAVAVRAILFDKTPSTNWNLAWHQDTKIAVKERVDIPGISQWSKKEGVVHCQPPVEILEKMVALRLHLDPCGEQNGPLRVIPRSHIRGILPGSEPVDEEDGVHCTCEIGDVILMKPLLLHASNKSEVPGHRRVIHIEYCSASLPPPLEWAYAAHHLKSSEGSKR